MAAGRRCHGAAAGKERESLAYSVSHDLCAMLRALNSAARTPPEGYAAAHREVPRDDSSRNDRASGCKNLLIDLSTLPDDKLRRFKARVGNPLYGAKDGVEALALLLDGPNRLASPPLAMLLDLKMPRMDGLELLQRLRRDLRIKLLPVVILTSSDEQEDLLRSDALGVNNYVCKSIDFVQFQETVGRLGLYWALINRLPRPE